MDTWNRLIAVGGEEEGGNGRRKGKGLIKEHVWIWTWTMERGLLRGDTGRLGGGRQKGKNRDNCNRINNKKIIKS